MIFNNEFDKFFQRLSSRFFRGFDSFGDEMSTEGPYYYGYELTVGHDGKPIVKEYGNVLPSGLVSTSGIRQPWTDSIIDEKEKTLKLVAELPGIEKSDIKITVNEGIATISAEKGDRKYRSQVPLKCKVDENSAKAKYSNGILEVTFNTVEEKPQGKTIPVE